MSSMPMIDVAVSVFIANTCIAFPQPNTYRVRGLCHLLATKSRGDVDITEITVPTLTGSTSEFFIIPMLPYINDFDTMYYTTDQLVVPARHYVSHNVQLPAEFHTSADIDLYEFVDIQIPCYVFIQPIGKLRRMESDDTYTFLPATVKYDMLKLSVTDELMRTRHGPAIKSKQDLAIFDQVAGRHKQFTYSLDDVQCIHCLEWPSQASEWSTRVRRYSYPDTATIQHVVSCGCDLVIVAHRRHKHNAWYRARMHRI